MSVSLFLGGLALPPGSLVDQRVPKKLLLDQGLPTAADKRAVQDGVEELLWVAALKPETIGVPAYRDEAREYLEIAVLTVSLRAQAKVDRLVELLHRAVPHPVFLVVEQEAGLSLSLAHKRRSQGEGGKVVVEEIHRTESIGMDAPGPAQRRFLESLALGGLPDRDLCCLYQAWIDRMTALQAAPWRGVYEVPDRPEQAAALRRNLEACARIQRELASIRARAGRERQMNRRVALNLEIRRLETELKALQSPPDPGKG